MEKTLFKIVLDRYRAACLGRSNQLCIVCRCPICLQIWPSVLRSEQLEGSPDLDYSVYRWLADEDGRLTEEIDNPYAFLVFKRGDYMATIVDYSDGMVHGLLFRDPYCYSWKTEHFDAASSDDYPSVHITLRFILTFILLAHVCLINPVPGVESKQTERFQQGSQSDETYSHPLNTNISY